MRPSSIALIYSTLIIIILFPFITEKSHAEDKNLTTSSAWNIQYLYGANFDLGKNTRDTLTFEHMDEWKYGDNFFFLDVNNFATRDSEIAKTTLYGEWHSRFSFSKILEKKVSWGLIDDLLTAHNIDFSENSLAYLNGLGFSLNLPGFDFANVNTLLRDNVDQDGFTWQVNMNWNVPFSLFGLHWAYGGFIDFAGHEGNLAWNIISHTQLLFDIGEYWGYNNQIWAGTEFLFWHNEFGIEGQNEFVPQMMVKWVF